MDESDTRRCWAQISSTFPCSVQPAGPVPPPSRSELQSAGSRAQTVRRRPVPSQARCPPPPSTVALLAHNPTGPVAVCFSNRTSIPFRTARQSVLHRHPCGTEGNGIRLNTILQPGSKANGVRLAAQGGLPGAVGVSLAVMSGAVPRPVMHSHDALTARPDEPNRAHGALAPGAAFELVPCQKAAFQWDCGGLHLNSPIGSADDTTHFSGPRTVPIMNVTAGMLRVMASDRPAGPTSAPAARKPLHRIVPSASRRRGDSARSSTPGLPHPVSTRP